MDNLHAGYDSEWNRLRRCVVVAEAAGLTLGAAYCDCVLMVSSTSTWWSTGSGRTIGVGLLAPVHEGKDFRLRFRPDDAKYGYRPGCTYLIVGGPSQCSPPAPITGCRFTYSVINDSGFTASVYTDRFELVPLRADATNNRCLICAAYYFGKHACPALKAAMAALSASSETAVPPPPPPKAVLPPEYTPPVEKTAKPVFVCRCVICEKQVGRGEVLMAIVHPISSESADCTEADGLLCVRPGETQYACARCAKKISEAITHLHAPETPWITDEDLI